MAPIPDPTPGVVVRYAYLWQSEALRDREEGSKYRPTVVVLASESNDGAGKTVLVAPVSVRRVTFATVCQAPSGENVRKLVHDFPRQLPGSLGDGREIADPLIGYAGIDDATRVVENIFRLHDRVEP